MLLGENGAGKSSLMKVLCGAYSADAGEFYHKGEKVTIASTADAQKLGIAVIFQEFSLVPYLDIAQNIFLGREPKGRIPGTIDRRKILADARRVLDSIGFEIDPSVTVDKLGVAQQQMVEIAKAISQNARILVMDEPTAALSDRETELLFAPMASPSFTSRTAWRKSLRSAIASPYCATAAASTASVLLTSRRTSSCA
jgi:ribose transport system ATP-binding protein